MGTRAPKFSCTGSHAALHRNETPYFSRLAEPPMASETRIAARTLKTTSAKNQVRRSNSASFQRAGCRRLEAWSSCGIVANAGDMDCAATAAPGILKNKFSIHRLACRIPQLRLPVRLDQAHHTVGHRHVVQLLRQPVALRVRPVEELEHLSRVLGLVLRPVHQDESSSGDRPGILARRVGED